MYQSAINAASALQKQVYETPQNKSEKTQNTQPSFSSNEGFRGYSVEVLSPPPSHFLCPITQDLMTEPVSVSCGHTFERSAIADWVKARKHNCPSCNQSININPNTWTPNWGIKSGIEEWKQKNEEPVVPLALSDSQSTLDLDKSDLLLKMAELHLKRDDFGKAVESYEEALQSTDSIETYLAYANLLEKVHSPKAGKAFLYLGRVYGKENKGERAIEAYQKASALDPENRAFLEELERCLELSNKTVDAVRCCEQLIALGKVQGCSLSVLCEYYKDRIALEPNEPRHYRAYWTFLKENGSKEAAKEVKHKLREVEHNAETYLAYANSLEIAHSPKAGKAFLYLGRLYDKENNGERAVDAYQKAVALQPDNRNFLEELAEYLKRFDRTKEAIHCYEQLISLGKTQACPLSVLTKYYECMTTLEPNEPRHYRAYWTFLKEHGKREAAKEVKCKLREIEGISWETENIVLKKKVTKLKERLIEMEKGTTILQEAVTTLQQRALELEEIEYLRDCLHRSTIIKLTNNDPSVKTVNFSANCVSLSLEAIKMFAKILEKNQMLQQLNLSGKRIGNEGALALAGALEKNQVLQQLNLSRNQIGNEGALALAGALEKNQVLQQLNLTWNQIGNEGALALAEALEKNRVLTQLNLIKGNDQIKGEGLQALIALMVKTQTIIDNSFLNDRSYLRHLSPFNNELLMQQFSLLCRVRYGKIINLLE